MTRLGMEHDFSKFAPNVTWDQAAIDAALAEPGLFNDGIAEQFQRRVVEALARGEVVTVTCMGKNVATFYPGGKTQHYDFDGRPTPPYVVTA